MSKTITNLALPLIIDAIESALEHQRYHPYRKAYAIPELRQKLITYVLNSAPVCYGMVEEDVEENYIVINQTLVPKPVRSQLQEKVAEGIPKVIEDNADWVGHHIPSEVDSGLAPSSWFG
ncbi:MAG TPA: hypothetical protein V6C64_12170 [Microcoleaceae cyanobacterium]|jgi:hypothetical protein